MTTDLCTVFTAAVSDVNTLNAHGEVPLSNLQIQRDLCYTQTHTDIQSHLHFPVRFSDSLGSLKHKPALLFPRSFVPHFVALS